MTDNSLNMRDDAIREVSALRILTWPAEAIPETCHVATEAPLSIAIEDVGDYTLMCTPTDTMALAVGFAFSEGLVSSADDIVALRRCDDDPGVIRMRLTDASAPSGATRSLIVVSSCGMCGTRQELARLLDTIAPVGSSMRASNDCLQSVTREMHERQTVFARTGGTHAAAVFSSDGRLIAFGEDIGRHNALDKAVGRCLLARRSLAGTGVALSGRISFEMVAKSARAGIEVIAAVSAPSSLAVEAADRWNITLCGFVRGDRATVYTHPQRIAG